MYFASSDSRYSGTLPPPSRAPTQGPLPPLCPPPRRGAPLGPPPLHLAATTTWPGILLHLFLLPPPPLLACPGTPRCPSFFHTHTHTHPPRVFLSTCSCTCRDHHHHRRRHPRRRRYVSCVRIRGTSYTHRSLLCAPRFPTLSLRFGFLRLVVCLFLYGSSRVWGHTPTHGLRSTAERSGCRISQGRELFGPSLRPTAGRPAGLARGDFDERIRRVPALGASRRTAFRSLGLRA